VQVSKVFEPVRLLLKLADSDKPCVGEVLPAMVAMRAQLEVEVNWGRHGAARKKQVFDIVDKRWLHHVSDCPVYEAGYALKTE
jgi:hypothetical protein